jgi:hypothetical protein
MQTIPAPDVSTGVGNDYANCIAGNVMQDPVVLP